MPRTDHDQQFKTLIREFIREFIRLFFPEWYERFDFETIKWLDKEIFLDPPRGETRTLDLVAEVTVRQAVASQRPGQPESWIILIHIEVEADDRITRLRPRMYDYYKGLRDRYQRPVWSLALYLHVGLDGVGWDVYEEYLWERRVLHFECPYVGLPRLDGEQYLNGENILGVALAVMMRVYSGPRKLDHRLSYSGGPGKGQRWQASASTTRRRSRPRSPSPRSRATAPSTNWPGSSAPTPPSSTPGRNNSSPALKSSSPTA